MSVCVCMSTSVHVCGLCTYECMHVCMCLYVQTTVHVHEYVSECVYIYIYECAGMHECMSVYSCLWGGSLYQFWHHTYTGLI